VDASAYNAAPDRNYSAQVPDLPGCPSTGATVGEVEREIKKAIRFHLDGLRRDAAPALQTSYDARGAR
jgi:predicted RNase H-like HicB family nuclease